MAYEFVVVCIEAVAVTTVTVLTVLCRLAKPKDRAATGGWTSQSSVLPAGSLGFFGR